MSGAVRDQVPTRRSCSGNSGQLVGAATVVIATPVFDQRPSDPRVFDGELDADQHWSSGLRSVEA